MTEAEGSQVVNGVGRASWECIGVWLLVGLGMAHPAAAQTDLTLEAAVTVAHRQARDIIKAKSDILLLDAQRVRALSAYLPSFDVITTASEQFRRTPITEFRGPVFCDNSLSNLEDCGSRNDFVEGPFVDRRMLNNASEPRFTLRILANQLIWDGGRSWVAIGRAKDNYDRARALRRRVENDLRLSVVRAFYGLARAEQVASAFRLRVDRSKAQLGQEKARRDEGTGSDADVAAAERNLSEDRLNLARRQLNVSRAQRTLNLTMGRRPDVPVRLSIPPTVTSTAPLDDVPMPTRDVAERMAGTRRPELTAQRHLVEIRKKDVDMQQAGYFPRVTLGAGYSRSSRRPDRVFDDPSRNFRANLDLVVRWTLLRNTLRASTGEEVAALQLTKSVADLEDLERRIIAEVHDRLESLQVRIQVYELARQGLRSAADAVRLAQERFNSGQSTLLTLRDAELKYTQAQVSAVNARLDVEIGQEELRRAIGG